MYPIIKVLKRIDEYYISIYLKAVGKSVPPHSLLPKYSRQERVHPCTLCCPIIFKLGRKECTPTLFPA